MKLGILVAAATILTAVTPAMAQTVLNLDGSTTTTTTTILQDSVPAPMPIIEQPAQPVFIEPATTNTVIIKKRHHLMNVGLPGLFGVHVF